MTDEQRAIYALRMRGLGPSTVLLAKALRQYASDANGFASESDDERYYEGLAKALWWAARRIDPEGDDRDE